MPRTGCGTTSTYRNRSGARPASPWDVNRRRSPSPSSRPRIRRISGRPPGGYFHGMVTKAKAGELNLDRTLWAMRRARRAEASSEHGPPGRIALAASTAMGLTSWSGPVMRTEVGRNSRQFAARLERPASGLA